MNLREIFKPRLWNCIILILILIFSFFLFTQALCKFPNLGCTLARYTFLAINPVFIFFDLTWGKSIYAVWGGVIIDLIYLYFLSSLIAYLRK